MKVFKDKELREPLEGPAHFGKVAAGTSKDISVYIVNDSQGELSNFKFSLDGKNVEIVQSPTVLKAGESGELKLKWSPSLKFKSALNAKLHVTADEVYSGVTALL